MLVRLERNPDNYNTLRLSKTADFYSQQLWKKSLELMSKRGIVFHHDNAKPQTPLTIWQKLRAGTENIDVFGSGLSYFDLHKINRVNLAPWQGCKNHLSQFLT